MPTLPRSLNRRSLLRNTAGTILATAFGTALPAVRLSAAEPQPASSATGRRENLPPIRQITHGPKFHWFGYYDKLEFDPTCRYVLAMEVDFQHRSPKPDDTIRVGMVDLQGADRWIELGASRAWCWQQGCMLQWLPRSQTEVLWNDRQDDRFVCHLLDVFSGKRRTLPHPIYAVSPDGRWGIAPDFARLNDCRPGYGYAGRPDENRNVLSGRLGHLSGGTR